MLRGFRVGQMCTCHFCNTEKGGVTHISGEGVIGGGSNDNVPKRALSNAIFSIKLLARSAHSFTPETGSDFIQKSRKLRPEVIKWAFPTWGWCEQKLKNIISKPLRPPTNPYLTHESLVPTQRKLLACQAKNTQKRPFLALFDKKMQQKIFCQTYDYNTS